MEGERARMSLKSSQYKEHEEQAGWLRILPYKNLAGAKGNGRAAFEVSTVDIFLFVRGECGTSMCTLHESRGLSMVRCDVRV